MEITFQSRGNFSLACFFLSLLGVIIFFAAGDVPVAIVFIGLSLIYLTEAPTRFGVLPMGVAWLACGRYSPVSGTVYDLGCHIEPFHWCALVGVESSFLLAIESIHYEQKFILHRHIILCLATC